MKKKILIISGGISKERLISLDTGLQVANELKKNGYNVKISELLNEDYKFLHPDNMVVCQVKMSRAALSMSGAEGEEGEAPAEGTEVAAKEGDGAKKDDKAKEGADKKPEEKKPAEKKPAEKK